MLNQNGMVIDWVEFYRDSVKSGWKYSTLRVRVNTALVDILGPEYWNEVLKRLDFLHSLQVDRQ